MTGVQTCALPILGINVVIGFLSPGVDWRAHLGGLATGAAVAAIMVFAPRRHRVLVQVLGIAAVVLILVAVVSWRTAQINELLLGIGQLTA